MMTPILQTRKLRPKKVNSITYLVSGKASTCGSDSESEPRVEFYSSSECFLSLCLASSFDQESEQHFVGWMRSLNIRIKEKLSSSCSLDNGTHRCAKEEAPAFEKVQLWLADPPGPAWH